MLLDIKVTKKQRLDPKSLDQILGYFFLARRARRADPTLPEIGRLALYYARHGELRLMPVEGWLQNPAFVGTEEWFFAEAKDLLSEDESWEEVDEAEDGGHE